MTRAAERSTYLDIIDADRGGGASGRAAERLPIATRKGDPRGPELARHYERCKADNAGRFRGKRLKNYCAAVAWTIANGPKKSPSTRKAPTMKRRMPPRDPRTGMFRPKARHRPKSGSEPRRAAPRRTTHAKTTTAKRASTAKRAAPRRSSAPAPRRASTRRSPGKRRAAPRSPNIAIVEVGAREMAKQPQRRGKRRKYSAKAPPMATAGGLVIAGVGGLLGYEMTELGDRYIAGYTPGTTPAPTLPAGVTDIATYNDYAQASKESMLKRLGWGVLMAGVGFIGGWAAPWAGLKMFLYGFGLGSTFNIGGRLLNFYVVQPLFAGGTTPSNTGLRMFQHEINAQAKLPTATTSGATQGLGAPPQQTSRNGTPIAAAAPAGRMLQQGPVRVPQVLAAQRRGTLGNAYDFSAVTGTPAAAPPASAPPAAAPPPAAASPGCAPCAPNPGPPQMAPAGCAGGPSCQCGQCGQPPEENRGLRHPMFRNMLRGSRDPWSRAA